MFEERETDNCVPTQQSEHTAEDRLARALDDLQARRAEIDLQKQAMRELEEQQQLFAQSYAAVFELAPIAIFEVSGAGVVGQCNLSAQHVIVGIAPGTNLADLSVDRGGHGQLQQLITIAERQGRATGIVEIDGRSYRVEAVTVVASAERRILVSLADTTEQIAAHREAERSANQLRSILRSARDGVALLYRNDVLYANEAWRELTGSSSSLGSLLSDVVEGRTLATRLAELARSNEHRSLDVRLGEGTEHEVLAELTAVAVEYESRSCVLVMARDLTMRRRLEAQVARSERLASLGMLVAGVAHEINNPLTYALGNLECLATRLEGTSSAVISGDEAREAVRDAIDGCQRIATIIRELRSFYRSDDHQLVLLEPNQVVRDAVRIVAPKCANVARLITDLGQVPVVLGVQTSLVQVLINLIVNAIDAMPERDASENVVRISTGCRGRDIRVEVSDNGRGISTENLSRIFEPFFSRGKASGTGLGLTISRNLVEQMNGWIDVDSRLGVGTRFIIHLEAAKRAPLARTSEPPQVSPSAIANARILIVDDEPLVARSVGRLLATAREVVCVNSVAQGLELLSSRSDIDLIISDWVMPDGGAPALVRALSAQGTREIPVIVMTGLGQLAEMDQFDGPCVTKPVSRSELLRAVSQALLVSRTRRSMVFGPDSCEPSGFRVCDLPSTAGSAGGQTR